MSGSCAAILSLDGGPEFRSNALKFFCDLFNIEIRWRPPGRSRGGAPIESLIGATEIEILAQAEGNTRLMKDPRLVTKSVNPFDRTKWTLCAVYRAFEYYLFEVRPNRRHPALGVTPKEYDYRRRLETGEREHLVIALNEDLMLLTSPHATRPFHKVNPIRGVWSCGLWYNHPSLKGLRKGTKAEVKLEPWLHRVIYVRLEGKAAWVAATCANPRLVGNRTYKEVEIAWRTHCKDANVKANLDTLSEAAALRMKPLWLPENFDPRIATQQSEMRYLYAPLGLTTAMPVHYVDETDEASTGRSSAQSADVTENDARSAPPETTPTPTPTPTPAPQTAPAPEPEAGREVQDEPRSTPGTFPTRAKGQPQADLDADDELYPSNYH